MTFEEWLQEFEEIPARYRRCSDLLPSSPQGVATFSAADRPATPTEKILRLHAEFLAGLEILRVEKYVFVVTAQDVCLRLLASVSCGYSP